MCETINAKVCINPLTHFPLDKIAAISQDISKCISMNEHVWISIKISLKFVPKGPIDNNPALG